MAAEDYMLQCMNKAVWAGVFRMWNTTGFSAVVGWKIRRSISAFSCGVYTDSSFRIRGAEPDGQKKKLFFFPDCSGTHQRYSDGRVVFF